MNAALSLRVSLTMELVRKFPTINPYSGQCDSHGVPIKHTRVPEVELMPESISSITCYISWMDDEVFLLGTFSVLITSNNKIRLHIMDYCNQSSPTNCSLRWVPLKGRSIPFRLGEQALSAMLCSKPSSQRMRFLVNPPLKLDCSFVSSRKMNI